MQGRRERQRETEGGREGTLAVHSRVQLKFWSGHKHKLKSVFVMIRELLNWRLFAVLGRNVWFILYRIHSLESFFFLKLNYGF